MSYWIVDQLPYAGPLTGAPDCPTAEIVRSLSAAIDGTLISDNVLGDECAYRWMPRASTCLDAIIADRSVAETVRQAAEQANKLIVSAARLIPVSSLNATTIFGDASSAVISETL